MCECKQVVDINQSLPWQKKEENTSLDESDKWIRFLKLTFISYVYEAFHRKTWKKCLALILTGDHY